MMRVNGFAGYAAPAQQQQQTPATQSVQVATAKSWESIPCPPPHPERGGHAHLLLDPVTWELTPEALENLARQYGDLVRYDFMGFTQLLCSNADLVQEVLQSPHFWDRIQLPYFGYCYSIVTGKPNTYGLVMRNGDNWRQHRRVANKALLNPKVVESFAPAINRHSKRLVDGWKAHGSGSKVTISDDLNDFTSGVILAIGFGEDTADLPASSRDKFVESVRTFFNSYTEFSRLVPPYPDSEQKRKLDEAMLFLRDYGLAFLRRRKALLKETNVNSLVESGKMDFLTLLATTTDDETGETIPEIEAIADMLDIMNGGTDTTSSLLTFGMHLLATNPKEQNDLYQEIVSVAGRDKPIIDAVDLAKMKLLGHNIKEMQRIFPSAPANGRCASEDTIVGGYHVPKGMHMTLNTWKIHRDPRYFENPLTFNPRRWEEKHHPFAWAPFGHGARSCIGMRLSLMESKLALAHIVRNFEIEPIDHNPPERTWAVTMRARNPVAFRLHHRK